MTDPSAPEDVTATFAATLVDEWARSGVTDAVVCPGSRSTPMALALAADERIRVHVHTDERSAGFMALGLGLASSRPAVVLTTSGTAAVELHPAVVEAYHSGVPLLAVTADRPPELRDVGAPQTIDQTHLFGGAVRWFADPGPPELAASGSWRSLGSRSVIEAIGSHPGPVHLNLPFREPLVGTAGPLPRGRDGDRPWHEPVDFEVFGDPAVAVGLVDRVVGRSGVIVAGEGIEDPTQVLRLASILGWPVLAEPRSGCRVPDPTVVTHADAILRTGLAASLRPEVAIRFGSLPASKIVTSWLDHDEVVSVVVHPRGAWMDPAGNAAMMIAAEPSRVAEVLARALDDHATSAKNDWVSRWREADRSAAVAVASVLTDHTEATEPATARDLVASLCEDTSLLVSSSMPIREVEWYAEARNGVRCYANRGANGIDGVLSTAVGLALNGGPTAVLLGDLAFLHDANGLLGAVRRGIDLVIVVIDNGGGGIFSFLPQAELLATELFEELFATPQEVDLQAIAGAHGVVSVSISQTAGLGPAVQHAQQAGGVQLIVVRTDRAANVKLHDDINEAVRTALG